MPKRKILRYAVSLTFLFVAASLLGFLAPIPGKRERLGTLLDSYVPFLALPPWMMSFVILLNNSAKSFAVLLSGILFGLVPLIAVAVNGYGLGLAYLFASGKVGYVQAAKTVLPLGVQEIPAVILAASYGLWVGPRCEPGGGQSADRDGRKSATYTQPGRKKGSGGIA